MKGEGTGAPRRVIKSLRLGHVVTAAVVLRYHAWLLTAGVWAVYSSGSEYSRNLRQQRRSEERGVFRVLRAGETTESRRRASAAPGTEVK